jgi:predicted Zn finger-like uncharacterized protein
VYTQCPDCATIFRVTAEALRFAQGDVRCIFLPSPSFQGLDHVAPESVVFTVFI